MQYVKTADAACVKRLFSAKTEQKYKPVAKVEKDVPMESCDFNVAKILARERLVLETDLQLVVRITVEAAKLNSSRPSLIRNCLILTASCLIRAHPALQYQDAEVQICVWVKHVQITQTPNVDWMPAEPATLYSTMAEKG